MKQPARSSGKKQILQPLPLSYLKFLSRQILQTKFKKGPSKTYSKMLFQEMQAIISSETDVEHYVRHLFAF